MYLSALYFGILKIQFLSFQRVSFGGLCITLAPCARRDGAETGLCQWPGERQGPFGRSTDRIIQEQGARSCAEPLGAGFHNMMEACGPIRPDSPLSGGSPTLIHSLIHSAASLSGQGCKTESCSQKGDQPHMPWVENQVPFWMDSDIRDYHCPTIC